MPDRDTTVLERLAVARLTHTVNELQIQVENDRKITPPRRKIYHCITDQTALTASIPELKRWISDGGMTMRVPLSALDALDKLKKGTEDANIHARESIRYLDRVQNPRSKIIRGVMIQSPDERFATWTEVLAVHPAVNPLPEDAKSEVPPLDIQQLLNCAIFLNNSRIHKKNANPADEVILVTNDSKVAAWAEVYGLKAVASLEVGKLLQREDIEFAERKRHYEYALANPTSPWLSTNRRGTSRVGTVGVRSERGGHGGTSGREVRRERADSRNETNGFGRGLRGVVEAPEYVLRTPPGRGVARGRGKLWEP